MEHQRQILRLGALLIALAAAIRLVSAGFFTPILSVLGQEKVAALLMYLETGRVVRFVRPQSMQQPEATEPSSPEETAPPEQPEMELPVFAPQELSLFEVQYQCDYRPDLEELLTQPLTWDLTGPAPTVLIVHTHATETYTGDDIEYSGTYRSLQAQHNMLSIGDEIARVLEQGGIRVLHDRTLHDYPDYNSSYSAARSTIEAYLKANPSIQMVLDIHRDASDSTAGQLITSATAGGQKSAQLMMVVGTDAGGNYHPHWQENLSLALKLTARLEQNDPGISRPVALRSERFNMDLTTGSLLVEVGAAGNTHKEALIAANALAQSILELAHGTR